eukprot:scaffold48719_cov76-Attheya_sp.AAC.4
MTHTAVLEVGFNYLNGTLPMDTASASLQFIDASNNKLEGTIPTSIGWFIELRELDLSFNNLTGTIPESFGELENMETLNLLRNRLEGVVPESLCEIFDDSQDRKLFVNDEPSSIQQEVKFGGMNV